MFQFHAMLLLRLAFLIPIMRASRGNIVLPEVEWHMKIKLYTSDPFAKNPTSNSIIISCQTEIFKNVLIP